MKGRGCLPDIETDPASELKSRNGRRGSPQDLPDSVQLLPNGGSLISNQPDQNAYWLGFIAGMFGPFVERRAESALSDTQWS